jgi:hypothetical protein
MDRRAFVRGLLGVAAAAAVVGSVTSEAEAAPLQVMNPDANKQDAERQEADFRPDVDGLPTTEKAQYYYYRRRRFRRRFYRRRRVYYYRPRRVYYRRRRVFYRRRYYW